MRKRILDLSIDDPSIHFVFSETDYFNQDNQNEAIIELSDFDDDKDKKAKHPNPKTDNGFIITLIIPLKGF